jgi:hypothetical protein
MILVTFVNDGQFEITLAQTQNSFLTVFMDVKLGLIPTTSLLFQSRA